MVSRVAFHSLVLFFFVEPWRNAAARALSHAVCCPPFGSVAAIVVAPPPLAVHALPTHQGGASVLELHTVSLPKRRTTTKVLRQRLAEVFFPDDPLHQFKNQSSARCLALALHYFFPMFQWGSAYSPRLLRSDLADGLIIASLAIPQARVHCLGESEEGAETESQI